MKSSITISTIEGIAFISISMIDFNSGRAVKRRKILKILRSLAIAANELFSSGNRVIKTIKKSKRFQPLLKKFLNLSSAIIFIANSITKYTVIL